MGRLTPVRTTTATKKKAATAPSKKVASEKSAAPKKRAPTVTGKRAQTVTRILERVEKKLTGKEMKASLGDYIRLVQLQKELEDEAPSEIRVSWVEKQVDKPKSENEK